jgi:acetolactate synthase-1/2/3 large subunit
MRVADWIAEYLHSIGVRRVHGLMGGGASGLNDGFIKHPGIEYICYHHEQGAGHAALGEAKYTGKLAVVNPTTGCAGTNCATSVLNGYQDGVPVLFLSGNVRLDNTAWHINGQGRIHIRHYGAQEHDIVSTMKSITKAAYFVSKPGFVENALKTAVFFATSGRPGPVWVDIPANVQTAQMPENSPQPFIQPIVKEVLTAEGREFLLQKITLHARPLIVAGMGIRQAGCVDDFIDFVEKHQIPFVTTYGAQDYAPYHHPLNIGTPGVRGNRAGNFAMQNADLLLFLGTSLGAPVVGYDPSQFNPTAYKIYIDIDENELGKEVIPVDMKVNVPIHQFLTGIV